MKLEAQGHELISLASKTYFLSSEDGDKLTCKGAMKRNVENPGAIFPDVLENKAIHKCTNMGFRVFNNAVYTYTQTKTGFSYLYVKREVEADGVHTKPLSICLNPMQNDHLTFIDFDSALCIFKETTLRNSYDYGGDSFFSVYQLLLFIKATFHDMEDTADEVRSSRNPFHLMEKKIKVPASLKWYECRKHKLRDAYIIQWLWNESYRETLAATEETTLVVCGLDTFWTCGLRSSHAHVTQPKYFLGNNVAGEILMEVREIVKGCDALATRDNMAARFEEEVAVTNQEQRLMRTIKADGTTGDLYSVVELFNICKVAEQN